MNGIIRSRKIILEQDPQTPSERFNATDDARTPRFCITQLFEHAVRSYPNEVAVISGQNELTYGALNSHANRLTRILTEERGVTRSDMVGVALDRSINIMSSLLAMMKAGAVYMAINPALTVGRVRQMIDDAHPKLIVTSDDTLAVMSCWKDMTLGIDAVRGELNNPCLTNLDLWPEDLAYIIYTSGSTGRPKGAEENHEALCDLLLAIQREPGCSQGDRLLAVVSVSFDISIADMFLPIVSGATLVIAQTHELRDPGALLELMQRHAITMTQATPSFWQMLLDSGWQEELRLAKIVAAGEPLSRQLAERLLSRADAMWSAYGPSEATIYASMGRVRRHDEDIIIGFPIPNVRLYVLRVAYLSPVSLGSLGELYIGGVGVNYGYHNSPELTKACFFDNPFHQGRLYRTGDLARFIAPGKLSVVGRSDNQVKVRGYRIELEDITTTINDHEDVSSAVVVSRDDHLVAYCICNCDNNHNGVFVESSLDSVPRPWLANLLPAYMIPAFFVRVNAFPMTVNGKIDQMALPDPIAAVPSRDTKGRPQTELEHRILAIWSDVLGHNSIGVTDNFFQIGGNPLCIPRVRTELERSLRQSVPTAELFEHYTIKTLAQYLEHRGNDNSTNTDSAHHPPGAQQEQRRPFADGHDDIAIISMACRLPGWNYKSGRILGTARKRSSRNHRCS